MALDPTDSFPRPTIIAVDRTYYDRNDALNAVSFHVSKMLQHQAQAASIIEQFSLPIELPGKKGLLEITMECARHKQTKEKS